MERKRNFIYEETENHSSADLLHSLCEMNDVAVSDIQLRVLREFVCAIIEENKKVNLLSRSDTTNIWKNHVFHSLSVIFMLRFPPNSKILDLGTGGGLPGIPIGIFLPSIDFTLVDSIQKKILAVSRIVENLNLKNIKTIRSRAEELATKHEFKNKFDFVVSRAAAPLSNLVLWTEKLLKKNSNKKSQFESKSGKLTVETGTLIAYKGGNLDSEIDEARSKHPSVQIRTIPISFRGSEKLSLVDKKLVLVKFTQ